jgi:hypothetical protein
VPEVAIDTGFWFLKMSHVSASFFCQHHQHEAWWCKIKTSPNGASCSTEVANLAPGEAPLERCVSKILVITMIELWEVSFEFGLAQKKLRLVLATQGRMRNPKS